VDDAKLGVRPSARARSKLAHAFTVPRQGLSFDSVIQSNPNAVISRIEGIVGEHEMRQLLCAGLIATLVGCQSGPPPMSVEEAKKVTADFAGVGYIPPPRTIADITAILDQQKPDDSYRAAVQARLDESPPTGANLSQLAEFYARRSVFALQMGLGTQAVADAREAVRYARESGDPRLMLPYESLKNALIFAGEPSGDITREVYARARTQAPDSMWTMSPLLAFTAEALQKGNVEEARKYVEESDQTLKRMAAAEPNPNGVRTLNAKTHAIFEAGIGHWSEAERWTRMAIDYTRKNTLSGSEVRPDSFSHPRFSQADWALGGLVTLLAQILIREGKLEEAEVAARESLLYNLRRSGRTSVQSANSIATLAGVLVNQGRYQEATSLREAEIATRDALGIQTWWARNRLADIRALEGRWTSALEIYAGAERDRPKTDSSPWLSSARFIAEYEGGDAANGLALANRQLALFGATLGDKNFHTALASGMVACGEALSGRRETALASFRGIFPLLRAGGSEGSANQNALDERRRSYVLETYLRTLIGTSVDETRRKTSETLEAFQVADAIRVAVTDRAVAIAASRGRAGNRELSEIVRDEQDAAQQLASRLTLLAAALAQPVEQQDANSMASLRREIEQLKQARAVLTQQIEKRFPDYSNLVNPPPASVEQARLALTNDEALIALYSGEREAYVWSLRTTGEVAFAVIPLRHDQLAAMVRELRHAVEYPAATLGEIPPFDVALAYRLYAMLLQPVEAGWKGAKRLVVAPHGPLAQIPFALLVTKPVSQPQDTTSLFSGYRDVPFLAREVAVTQVPSVATLTILRGMPVGDPTRRAFAGFGDPWFGSQQAAEAKSDSAALQVRAVEARGLLVRAAPGTETLASANLSMLPRLPDTAVEVREVGQALHADPSKDIFLGSDANEWQVRNMKLDDRRVVMFATHGLVPGDLDGLDQPALALSAPAVAGVGGDGLLTMDKILGLKLDADWVVLSACNTAAGSGAGAEAVSGLGRAFFYAGARALLVTNWPVETTSARKLTTTVFQHQGRDATMPRAEALRQSMLELIDGPGYVDSATGKVVASYAHPLFWAPFSLIGDGQ
jgi:CHAT domain-containing protein